MTRVRTRYQEPRLATLFRQSANIMTPEGSNMSRAGTQGTSNRYGPGTAL